MGFCSCRFNLGLNGFGLLWHFVDPLLHRLGLGNQALSDEQIIQRLPVRSVRRCFQQIRFLIHVPSYSTRPGEQHRNGPGIGVFFAPCLQPLPVRSFDPLWEFNEFLKALEVHDSGAFDSSISPISQRSVEDVLRQLGSDVLHECILHLQQVQIAAVISEAGEVAVKS